MPIPFILGAIAATAVVGLGTGIKAAIDQSDANNTNQKAEKIAKKASEQANLCKKNCKDAINDLGKTKISVLDGSIKLFADVFDKINNIELSDSVGLEELQKFRIDKQSLTELKEIQTIATSLAGGIAGGAAIMLGGLALGPAIAVMGLVVGAKASENKDNAYANLAKSEEFEEQMSVVNAQCKAIRMRTTMFERLLLKLNAIFEPLVYSLEDIVTTSGTDYSKYTQEEKAVVAASLSLAGAIKKVLDTPLLTEDGRLTEASEKVIPEIDCVLRDKNVRMLEVR